MNNQVINQNPNQNPKIIKGEVSYILPLKNQCIKKISNQEIDPNTKMKFNSLNECITKMKLNNNNVPKFKNETIEPSLKIDGTNIVISFDFSKIFQRIKTKNVQNIKEEKNVTDLIFNWKAKPTLQNKILKKFTTEQNINVETGINREKNKKIQPKSIVLSMTNIEWIDNKLTMTIDIQKFFQETVVNQKILPKLKLSKKSIQNGLKNYYPKGLAALNGCESSNKNCNSSKSL